MTEQTDHSSPLMGIQDFYEGDAPLRSQTQVALPSWSWFGLLSIAVVGSLLVIAAVSLLT